MEQQPTTEILPQYYNELKLNLLAGAMAPRAFLDQIFKLDQSTPERLNAVYNISLLTQNEIVNFFENDLERENFFSTRSLAYLHRGQLLMNNNEAHALDNFEQALLDAREAGVQYTDWALYVEATVLYLRGDVKGLETLFHANDSNFDGNRALVKNLLCGLEERGYPDYREDCAKRRD